MSGKPIDEMLADYDAGKLNAQSFVQGVRAIQALTAAQQQGQAVAWSVVRVGNYGAAYDDAGARRAFTYDHQPGNVEASRLGAAVTAAANTSAGDSIDRGLCLLKALSGIGYGVFQIGQPDTAPPPSVPEPKPVPYGSPSGEKDYAYGYEKGHADGWNACRAAMLAAAPSAQEERRGSQ